MPLKTARRSIRRARDAPVDRARAHRCAAARSSSSGSTNLPSGVFSSSAAAASSVRAGRLRRARGSAARRVCAVGACQARASPAVSSSSALDLAGRFPSPSASASSGSMRRVGVACSRAAAARRVARSGTSSLQRGQRASSSAPRRRLLTTTSSRSSGSGVTACRSQRRSPASPLTMQHLPCRTSAARRRQRLQQRATPADRRRGHERADRLRSCRRCSPSELRDVGIAARDAGTAQRQQCDQRQHATSAARIRHREPDYGGLRPARRCTRRRCRYRAHACCRSSSGSSCFFRCPR